MFTPSNWSARLLKGSLIGIADPIPGVSGGTIAYLTGMYDEIIARTSQFFSHPDGWLANAKFLLPIVVGLLIGIFGFAHLLAWLLTHYPQLTQQAFVGLVIGSLLAMLRSGQLSLTRGPSMGALLIAACVAGIFGVLPQPEVTHAITNPIGWQWGFIFIAGVVAAATMLIPGISGSMLQLLIGSYATYITAIKSLNWPIILVFFAGAVLGIIVAAKVMNRLFYRYYQAMQALIGGLVLGSVIVLWPWQLAWFTQLQGAILAAVMAAMVVWIQSRRP